MHVQLLFAHRCSHSDCLLLRCTVATAERSFAPPDRSASLPSHGRSTVGSTVHHPAQQCAPRCVRGTCTADAPSAEFHPPADFCRVASSRTAAIPRRAHARAAGATSAQCKATTAWRTPTPTKCTGFHSQLRACCGGERLQAMQPSSSKTDANKLCLQRMPSPPLLGECFRAYHACAAL
jgi:hypothetical protein